MSDRIALMEAGRILQLGTPAELYERPASLTVARFIGTPTINLLPAEIDATGRVTLQGMETGIIAPAQAAGAATLGLRPEDLRIARTGIRAQVERAEHHGADRYVTLRPEGQPDLRLTLRQSISDEIGTGTVTLGFSGARAHLFGADGARLDCRFAERVSA